MQTLNNDTATPIDLLDWLTQDFGEKKSTITWQIYKCQLTDSLISQHEPMKLIYHYERLDDEQKANFPLNGALLKQFDRLMNREDFAELLKIDVKNVAKPWQLKFSGKLVIFSENPEVAIRLHWTNTLKPFEPVYTADLATAVEQAFNHWQFVDTVEVISKSPRIRLIAPYKTPSKTTPSNTESSEQITTWQPMSNQQFEPMPAPLALEIQHLLTNSDSVQQLWLPRLKESALEKASEWQENLF